MSSGASRNFLLAAALRGSGLKVSLVTSVGAQRTRKSDRSRLRPRESEPPATWNKVSP